MPEFINHPRPDLSVDYSAFNDVGCQSDEQGILICDDDSPLASFGCDRIASPLGLIGGLDPAYSIAVCIFESYLHWEEIDLIFDLEEDGFVYSYGGLNPTYIRYVIYINGEYKLIKTMDELQNAFAPIESRIEALSYALASNDYSAYFGLAYDRNLRYLVDIVEDTHVEKVENGYLVHLYYYRFFGCGPHTTSALEVLVTHNGEVEEMKVEGVFEDPEEDNLCID